MILLAFDVGRKKTGVAIGNSLTGNARPLSVIRGGRTAQLAAIGAHIAKWRPDSLLVGLPVHLDGGEHAMTKFCRAFGNLLRREFKLPVEFADERLTTFAARAEIRSNGGKSTKHTIPAKAIPAFAGMAECANFSPPPSAAGDKKSPDAAAAGIILRDWLRERAR